MHPSRLSFQSRERTKAKMTATQIVAIISVACLCVFFMRWVCKTLDWLWFKPRRLERELRKKGLKGNPYRFLVGDARDSSKMLSQERQKSIPFTHDYFHHVNPFQHQLLTKYGKNFVIWFGPIPAINITEPAKIREAFMKMNEFQKPIWNPLVKLLAPGLVSLEGEKWAKHRKLINPAFHMEKLKLMFPAFCTSIIQMINKWEEIVSATGSSEVDVLPDITTLTADVISRSAFGSSYKEAVRLFELITEQTELTLRLFQSIYLPGWKYVPTKNNKRMKEVNAQIQKLLKGIIKKRKKEMEASELVKDDLLGLLLESDFKETQSNYRNKQYVGMSFQEIIDECKLFFLAGQETTSALLVWTMILLGKHQDWQARARQEVFAKFGGNQPNFDGLNHLKTVTMILNEVLRLYPSVILVNRRLNTHDTKLDNLSIPSGVVVSLSILHAHQDPKIWGDDVLEFNPERFSEGIAKAMKGTVSFFPFGWGPRICLGQNFAMTEAKMALAMILQHFSFELSPSYVHAPRSVITLRPGHGAHIILRKL